MHRLRHLALAPLLMACAAGDTDSDTDPPVGPAVTVNIHSPANDAHIIEGIDVLLSAIIQDRDGASLDLEVRWRVGVDWAVVGNNVQVDDLPMGTYALSAMVSQGGEEFSDVIDITVVASAGRHE